MGFSEWLAKKRPKDSEEMRLARRKDYWFFIEIGGLIINWDKRYFIPNVAYISLLVINHTYVVLCFLVTALKSSDMSSVCQFLNFFGIVTIAILLILIFAFNQEDFVMLTSVAAKELFDYGSSFSGSVAIEGWYKRGEKLKKISFIVTAPWLFLIALSTMISDIVDAAFSFPKTNETIINGLHQTLPMKMYCFHPIPNEFVRTSCEYVPTYFILLQFIGRYETIPDSSKENFVETRWLTILSQGTCTLGTGIVVTAGIFLMFFSGQHIITQLKYLNMAIRDIDNMAAKQYESELGVKPPTRPLDKTNDRQLMGFYKFYLKKIVEHHKEILRYSKVFHFIVNWPAGLVVVNGSVVVAMSMLSIMRGGGQPSVLLTSIQLVVAELAAILMICEVGEAVRNQSEELFDSMYSFDWMDNSQDVKTLIFIVKLRMQKPIILHAGSLTPIDRNMFSSMMNTAYSYMNLALANDQGDAH